MGNGSSNPDNPDKEHFKLIIRQIEIEYQREEDMHKERMQGQLR